MKSELYFTLAWTLASVLALVLAFIALLTIYVLLSIIQPGFLASDNNFVVVGGSVITLAAGGIQFGLVQWYFCLRWKIPGGRWMIASAISFPLYWISLQALLGYFPPLFTTDYKGRLYSLIPTFASDWFINVLLCGTVWGIVFGTSYWLALRSYTNRAYIWLITSFITGVLIFGWYVALASLLKDDLIAVPLYCVTCPVLFGLLTGGTLYRLLYRKKRREDDSPFY